MIGGIIRCHGCGKTLTISYNNQLDTDIILDVNGWMKHKGVYKNGNTFTGTISGKIILCDICKVNAC